MYIFKTWHEKWSSKNHHQSITDPLKFQLSLWEDGTMTSSARKKPARQQAPRAAVPIRSSSNGTRILARGKASPDADPYISGKFLLPFSITRTSMRPTHPSFNLFLRLEGRDSGGLNCQTNENYPCRTAKAAQVVVSHFGMTCSASILSTSMILLVVVTSFHLIS